MDDGRDLALTNVDHRFLVRAAARLLGPAEAEDAVQDAYVRALEADALQLNAAQAWLLTVVRHLAIDQLRRRQWMQQWLAAMDVDDAVPLAPSAEADMALAQEVARALRWLAARLPPADGAAVLLHDVFEVGHAEIARARGTSEPASRQQLLRALRRLRQAADVPDGTREPTEETALRLYLHAVQLRDPRSLWAMLRQPTVQAMLALPPVVAQGAGVPRSAACGVVQVGGQLGLALTLDGVTLCVLPLGAQAKCEADAALV